MGGREGKWEGGEVGERLRGGWVGGRKGKWEGKWVGH